LDDAHFDGQLFIARRKAEIALQDNQDFYIASLSRSV